MIYSCFSTELELINPKKKKKKKKYFDAALAESNLNISKCAIFIDLNHLISKTSLRIVMTSFVTVSRAFWS